MIFKPQIYRVPRKCAEKEIKAEREEVKGTLKAKTHNIIRLTT